MPLVLAHHFRCGANRTLRAWTLLRRAGQARRIGLPRRLLGGDCAGSVPTHAAARRENRRRRAGTRPASQGDAESPQSLAEGARAAHYGSISAGGGSGLGVRAGATTAGSLDNAVRAASADRRLSR